LKKHFFRWKKSS